MRRAIAVLAAALSGWLPARPAPAQQPGQRIRLQTEASPSRWLTGTLVGERADSLRMEVAGHPAVSVARRAVLRLEVSRGQQRPIGPGAAQGADFGALVGAVVAARGMAKPCAWPTAAAVVCGERRILVGSGLGGAVGALVGAAIGSLIRTERWERASLAPPQVVLTAQGTGLALSVAF
jgi:hypothetical protein